MRNLIRQAMDHFFLLCGIWLISGGCANTNLKQRLDAGYNALEAHEYDQALSVADDVLRTNPNGPGTAEAYYLRGRVYEWRAEANPAEASTDLQTARTAYINAVESPKSPQLEALIRAGVGNVAYYQDDYETAVKQLGAAFDNLQKPEDRAWDLYRLGVSQQRLGHWEDADRTFASVQQQFGGTEPARRAQQHQGARAFWVIVPFATPAQATGAMPQFQRRNLPVTAGPDAKTGRPAVRIGPYPDYGRAASVKAGLMASYPDLTIEP